ncbi:MAG: OpgC domain-containing protein [Mesorhizobium sp.]|nr:OpgC domain-containing protein [Mesorhizobium sp.]MCO5163609.1 OpgC domain-containing protein [Mesorhizobium sp.]
MRAERDTRIDVIRAIVLLMIFINHVPGNVYETLTLKNYGFSDAAEVFVLISGLAVGLAYGAKTKDGQWIRAMLAIWRRAWVLFYTHIMTTVATLAIFCGAAVFGLRSDLLTMINIGPLIDDPARTIVGIATLSHQLGYNNILPLYMALLAATPAILWLLKRNMAATLAGSGALWLAAGLYQIAPANYPLPGVWFLNPLSWQFLYVIGVAGTMHVSAGGSLPQRPIWTRLAVAYLLAAFLMIRSPFWGEVSWFGLPEVLGGFNKTYLSLFRLLDVLALAYLVARWPTVSNLARLSPDHPLAILGKHSLPAFVTGTLCAMVAQVLRHLDQPGLGFDTLLIATGIAIQFAVAYFLEWKAGTMRTAAAKKPKEKAGGHVKAQPVPA